MPFREFVSDLAEVLQGVKNDVILTALGGGSDNPQNTAGDVKDIASVLSGQGGVSDVMGITAAAYAKGLDVLEARADRIEAGLEGAEDRGRDRARETMDVLSTDGNLPDPALRALSDVCASGIRRADDMTPVYLEAWQEGQEALYETAKPSAFDEISQQRLATADGFKAEIGDTCEATWGYPSAQEARESGVLDPLVPNPDISAAADTGASAEPVSDADTELETESATDVDLQPPDLEDSEGSASPTARGVETDLDDGIPTVPSAVKTHLETASNPAAVISYPAVDHGATYITGDGDLAAQNQGHEAWVEAEAAEDTALAASAAAVDEPTAYDDPETYTSDGDMTALTEAYDWEAEHFDEGATLFDEPATDVTVITPEQPVTVPDAGVREPDEPEV